MAANIYTAARNTSPPRRPPEPTSDDVSLFLQKFIVRSSSSSSASSPSFTSRHYFAALSDLGPDPGAPLSDPGQISAPDPTNPSSRFGLAPANADECDYESEDVPEAAAAPPKATACRSSSKRSRAAEVHNQSEKRRRSRINEKMKALQNLIPNSNKTDKASMLDEAIEYLKQLQLQVQMLTMRNGFSLHPICGPGTLLQQQPHDQYASQMTMGDNLVFNSTLAPSNANPAESIYMDHQNIPADPLNRPRDECTTDKQARVTDFSCMIDPTTSVKVESESTLDLLSTYQRLSSSKNAQICQPLIEDSLQTSSTGAKAASLIPLEANTSQLKESTLEACLAGGDHLLQNFVNHPMFSSHLSM